MYALVIGDEIEFVRYGDSKTTIATVVWMGRGEIDYTPRPVALVVDDAGRDAAVYSTDNEASDDGEWCDAAMCASRDWVDSAGDEPPADMAERIDVALNLQDIITVTRDNDKDLCFKGELIAEVSSFRRGSNDTNWTELNLYRTSAGKYIAEEIGRTRRMNQHDRHAATVCDSTAEVIDALGTGWLAKQVYESAGISCVERVE